MSRLLKLFCDIQIVFTLLIWHFWENASLSNSLSLSLKDLHSLFHSIPFYSVLFCSTCIVMYSFLFCSSLVYQTSLFQSSLVKFILFFLLYSILFYSILLYSTPVQSILFFSILLYSMLFYPILFYSILYLPLCTLTIKHGKAYITSLRSPDMSVLCKSTPSSIHETFPYAKKVFRVNSEIMNSDSTSGTRNHHG